MSRTRDGICSRELSFEGVGSNAAVLNSTGAELLGVRMGGRSLGAFGGLLASMSPAAESEGLGCLEREGSSASCDAMRRSDLARTSGLVSNSLSSESRSVSLAKPSARGLERRSLGEFGKDGGAVNEPNWLDASCSAKGLVAEENSFLGWSGAYGARLVSKTADRSCSWSSWILEVFSAVQCGKVLAVGVRFSKAAIRNLTETSDTEGDARWGGRCTCSSDPWSSTWTDCSRAVSGDATTSFGDPVLEPGVFDGSRPA